MFEIIVSNAARKGAKKLPEDMREKVAQLLYVLEDEPVPVDKYDIKKMKGISNTYRIRMGDWRIIYRIEFSIRRIIILKIESRGRVYK